MTPYVPGPDLYFPLLTYAGITGDFSTKNAGNVTFSASKLCASNSHGKASPTGS